LNPSRRHAASRGMTSTAVVQGSRVAGVPALELRSALLVGISNAHVRSRGPNLAVARLCHAESRGQQRRLSPPADFHILQNPGGI
jgi:hypothetical protein